MQSSSQRLEGTVHRQSSSPSCFNGSLPSEAVFSLKVPNNTITSGRANLDTHRTWYLRTIWVVYAARAPVAHCICLDIKCFGALCAPWAPHNGFGTTGCFGFRDR